MYNTISVVIIIIRIADPDADCAFFPKSLLMRRKKLLARLFKILVFLCYSSVRLRFFSWRSIPSVQHVFCDYLGECCYGVERHSVVEDI